MHTRITATAVAHAAPGEPPRCPRPAECGTRVHRSARSPTRACRPPALVDLARRGPVTPRPFFQQFVEFERGQRVVLGAVFHDRGAILVRLRVSVQRERQEASPRLPASRSRGAARRDAKSMLTSASGIDARGSSPLSDRDKRQPAIRSAHFPLSHKRAQARRMANRSRRALAHPPVRHFSPAGIPAPGHPA